MTAATTTSANSETLRLKIWRSVDEIDVSAWDSLRSAGDVFMDVRFLRAVERSMTPQTGFWYVMFQDAAGEPAAIACLSTYVVDGTMLVPHGPLKRSLGVLGKVLPLAVYYKVLFCGIPLSAGQSHVRFAEGADVPAIIASLCRMMDEIAGAERARVIVMKEFRNDERSAIDLVLHHGFRRADSPPMNLLRPAWDSFEGYLDSLTSKRRWNIRHSLKKLARGNVQIIRPHGAAEVDRLLTADVHRLYEQVFARSETKLEFMPLEFFRQLAVELPEQSRFQFVTENEQVLGFGASVFGETSYHALLAGIDYSRNGEFDLYFNVVYDTLADALSSGVREIHFGANADQFKQSRLECRPDPRSIYIKGARPPIRLILRLLFDRLFPPIPGPATIVDEASA